MAKQLQHLANEVNWKSYLNLSFYGPEQLPSSGPKKSKYLLIYVF